MCEDPGNGKIGRRGESLGDSDDRFIAEVRELSALSGTPVPQTNLRPGGTGFVKDPFFFKGSAPGSGHDHSDRAGEPRSRH